MKKIMFLVLVLGVFLSSSIASAYSLNVYADNSSWTDTSIDINQSDFLSISASGLATNNRNKPAGSILWVTPDGYNAGVPTDSRFVVPELENWFSLVGKIGDNTPFEVGSSFEEIMYDTGRLYLLFNDTYYPDNDGHWIVDVAPVPEPATMLLFGTGLAGLVGTRLRRKKK